MIDLNHLATVEERVPNSHKKKKTKAKVRIPKKKASKESILIFLFLLKCENNSVNFTYIFKF